MSKKYKSKQEQVESEEFNAWFKLFKKYCDYKEENGSEPSIGSEQDHVSGLATWAQEQDDTLNRSKEGENNIMKRNIFISSSWEGHRFIPHKYY